MSRTEDAFVHELFCVIALGVRGFFFVDNLAVIRGVCESTCKAYICSQLCSISGGSLCCWFDGIT